MMKLNPRAKIVMVFLAGLILGCVLTRVFLRPERPSSPQAMRNHILGKLSGNLDLSDDQRSSFEGLIKNMQGEFIDFRVRHQDEIRGIIEKYIGEAKTHLSPGQQEKLDRIYREKIRKRWAEDTDKSRLE